MSRHNKYADDSARVSLIAPKQFIDSVRSASSMSKRTMSDVLRECFIVGYAKLYGASEDEKKQ
jgi:hypothetical protein